MNWISVIWISHKRYCTTFGSVLKCVAMSRIIFSHTPRKFSVQIALLDLFSMVLECRWHVYAGRLIGENALLYIFVFILWEADRVFSMDTCINPLVAWVRLKKPAFQLVEIKTRITPRLYVQRHEWWFRVAIGPQDITDLISEAIMGNIYLQAVLAFHAHARPSDCLIGLVYPSVSKARRARVLCIIKQQQQQQ